jgi:hypothetical protein
MFKGLNSSGVFCALVSFERRFYRRVNTRLQIHAASAAIRSRRHEGIPSSRVPLVCIPAVPRRDAR